MLAKIKTPPIESGAAATATIADFNSKLELIRRREMAEALARNPDDADRDRGAAARRIAGDLRRLAERDYEAFSRETRRLKLELEDARPAFAAAVDQTNMIRRQTSNSIAAGLQPRHRRAVADIGNALEALSRAILAERQIRDEFSRRAPEPTSRFLPDMSPAIGTLAEWDSVPAQWARAARKNGFLS
jgi:hypothetical protein